MWSLNANCVLADGVKLTLKNRIDFVQKRSQWIKWMLGAQGKQIPVTEPWDETSPTIIAVCEF